MKGASEVIGDGIEKSGTSIPTKEQIELIKATVAKGATDLELKLFLYQCQRTGLDPLSKQIHFIKRFNRKIQKEEGTIQTGIDGYRTIADRTGDYAGSDDALFSFSANSEYPESATVTVYRIVRGQRCAFTATARWSEYYPGDEKEGFFWRKMPSAQLAKCAEALALRKAFPQQLPGVYADVEMQQAQSDALVEAQPTPPKTLPAPKSDEATETVGADSRNPRDNDCTFIRYGYVADVSPRRTKDNKPYTVFRLCRSCADAAQKNGFSVSCFDAAMSGALNHFEECLQCVQVKISARRSGAKIFYNLIDMCVQEKESEVNGAE